MTVFVGPNNSGKSLVLRELQQYSEHGRLATQHIVNGIEIGILDETEVDTLVHAREAKLSPDEIVPEGHVRVARHIPASGSANNFDVNLNHLKQQFSELENRRAAGDTEWWQNCWNGIYSQFTNLFTIILDGKTRLSLTEQRAAGDLLGSPLNHLASLFQDDDARKLVRRITHEAFGLYFVIDPTHSGYLRIRMSDRPPSDQAEEQALDVRSRKFHSTAASISDLSDGVKAFTGLVSALISSDYRIMLVDEPEAFLHPPLAGQLGREMATLADTRSGNVFASTHSSRFLMGCIESGKSTNVVRLTYKDSHATARVLPEKRIRELMQDPLLRSAGILEALFYSGAVVCEADRDRVFYTEINTRLQRSGLDHIADSVFLNAQNKQTIRRIVGPLREMGIPAAVIVDFDVIKGNDLKDLLNCCFVPPQVTKSLGQLRGEIEGIFRDQSIDMNDGGLTSLKPEERESCQSLLDQLSSYGIFVVPNGAVESWLDYLGVSASKQNWLPAIFERMKTDPDDPDYVEPATKDVWKFLAKVASWVSQDDRRGMPRSTINVKALS